MGPSTGPSIAGAGMNERPVLGRTAPPDLEHDIAGKAFRVLRVLSRNGEFAIAAVRRTDVPDEARGLETNALLTPAHQDGELPGAGRQRRGDRQVEGVVADVEVNRPRRQG